jgi:hypothetical protein
MRLISRSRGQLAEDLGPGRLRANSQSHSVPVWLVFLLLDIALLSYGGQPSEGHVRLLGQGVDMSFRKMVICLAMFAATFDVLEMAVGAQNLRELAREQAQRKPGVPLDQPSAPRHFRSKTIEELAKEADVVLQGKLSRINSYLAPREDRVLTAYSISVIDVIAGRMPTLSTPTPGSAVLLILTVYGGEVLVEGVLIRGRDNNREDITDGGQYLMFLRPSRPPEQGHYEIYYGGIFEIQHDKMRSIFHQANEAFRGWIDARPQDLMLRIRTAAPVR